MLILTLAGKIRGHRSADMDATAPDVCGRRRFQALAASDSSSLTVMSMFSNAERLFMFRFLSKDL